jgi:hypothetical protein
MPKGHNPIIGLFFIYAILVPDDIIDAMTDIVADKVALVTKTLRDHMSSFADVGFVHDPKKAESSHSASSDITLTFTNPKTNFKIWLSFTAGKTSPESFAPFGKSFFTMAVINKDGKYLSVDDYLEKYKHKKELAEKFSNNSGLDFSKFCVAFFDVLDRLLTVELKNILNGTEWVDIPIDWQGYK